MSAQSHTPTTLNDLPYSIEKMKETPPFSRRFLDKDNEISRRIYLCMFLTGCFMVVVSVFTVLAIYWGSMWRVPAGDLHGWVVDFDGGLVGRAVVRGLTTNASAPGITWTVVSAREFPGGISQLREAVIQEETWVAIAVNEGATARFQSSCVTPNAAYDGSNAITVYANEARSDNAYRVLLRPSFETSLTITSQSFANQESANELVSSGNLTSLLLISPQTITTPIWYTIDNLAPYDVPVATAATFVGLIYQLIFTFIVVVSGYVAREASGLNRHLTLRSLLITRFASSFGAFFLISLSFSLLSLAFQVDFNRHYGSSGFVIFWMVNLLETLATGLALEVFITVLRPQFIPFFMILWVIANVAVCAYPIEVLPSIFRYGYAAPFYNVNHAIRSIIFGTKNSLALNFGVLLVWMAISCVTLPLIQWYVRRQAVTLERRQAMGRAPSGLHMEPANSV